MKTSMYKGAIRIACFASGLLLVAGCTSLNKIAASKLATQGAQVATTSGQSYQSTDQALVQFVEGEYLLSGLSEGYSPPTSNMLNSISVIRKELQLRQQMLSGLSSLYVSFGALCDYDAQGEVEKSIGSTVQAGNSLSGLLGGGEISDSAGKLFANTGGAVVGRIQSQRINNASAKIRSALQGIVLLLQQSNEQAALVSMRKSISEGKLRLVNKLWEDEFASASGIIDQHIQVFGLTPNESAVSAAAKNPGIKKGIEELLKWRQKQEEDSQAAAYDATIQALRSLVNEHSKIEAGEAVSLDAIQGYMATIQQYVNLITDIKKGN